MFSVLQGDGDYSFVIYTEETSLHLIRRLYRMHLNNIVLVDFEEA